MRHFVRNLIAGVAALSLLHVSAASAQGLLVTTEQLSAAARLAAGSPQARIASLLDRPEVQTALTERGVPIEQARLRVAALTDDEAQTLAERIDRDPAGAADVLAVLLVVFIVLLITDILGYTKVFSFTRPMK